MQQFDMKEEGGADGLHFVLAIRKQFTSQLPNMFSRLEQAISDKFSKEISDCDAGSGPELVKAAMQFVMDTFVVGKIIRAAPKYVSS